MKLSIIIPIYNEKKTIISVLDAVNSVDLGDIEKEIILVDDYSTDGSRDILKDLESEYKVIYHKKNCGKGRALRSGFEHVTGDIIIIQDADLEYDPNDYVSLLDPILKGKTKVVYGSRFLGKRVKLKREKYKLYYIGNQFLTFMTSVLYLRKITDMETCYKVFKREVIDEIKPNLKSQRFDFEPEITAKVIKRGYKIVEVPIWYKCRDFDEGKKITWKDGMKALWYLLKYRIVN
ncbi:glycosyltransferase family 2 protein [archaeon]|jgi:glycosyltransferase involved in cell wall biosynthesis|nr:glycosyltransferase family 2 protein [archaeon]MBT4441409.1 glycosyltransferase family 2 protein [archaeon]